MFAKRVYTFIALIISLLACCSIDAQEICNNGVDDDSDYLADLHDPDCQCHFNVNGNLLQNGSFELYDHCPVTYIYTTDHNIANYWEYGTYTNINEASFYHNLKCSYDAEVIMNHMPPALPLPDGDGFISILKSAYINPAVQEKDMSRGYVAQCLQAPLQPGEDYTLSFYGGRFRSWDNLTGKIYPFTVAIFGNTDCNAVPFGKANVLGNGCPLNYAGWVLLGKTVVYSSTEWVQSKISFSVPSEINVIEVGPDCSILAPIFNQADSTTYLDYYVYYLDDLHLLPTKDFPFEYIHLQTASSCTNSTPVLQAPDMANATYQWYKDSVAITGATNSTYQLQNIIAKNYYNVLITTDSACIISEPFLITPSQLNEIHIPADTTLCLNNTLNLAPALDGIIYTVNGSTNSVVAITKEGMYTITATDIYGCEKTFSTKVTEQNCSDCDALIPTAFTPNGDGLNDMFKAKILCSFTYFNCRIFNRWGQVIFESRDIYKGWDGTYSSNKMPPGTYVYLIQYKTTSNIIRSVKGLVTIIL
ncbi:MAG: gliding motility-associated C-terminal domain-containing protein [Panacibacter sp.]